MSPSERRTAYVVKMHPRFSETFVVNELRAVEAAGEQVDVRSWSTTTAASGLLDLRAAQGRCSGQLARAAADAVLEGYAPTCDVLERLPAYDAAARCRLVAVYGFRPAWAGVRGLLGPVPARSIASGHSAAMPLSGRMP